MKKKEILVIFVLAVLVVGGSWFYTRGSHAGCLLTPFIHRACIKAYFPYHFNRGSPISWWKDPIPGYPRFGGFIDFLNLVLDLLFWFLVIFAFWKAVEIIRKRIRGIS